MDAKSSIPFTVLIWNFRYSDLRVIPSAALCEGEFGVDGYFIGVPTVIGAGGIEKILEFKLLPEEQEMLNKTLIAVKKTVAETKL